MKQVFVSGRGEIETLDVPAPLRMPRSVLVQNVRSLISSGTEGAAVSRHGGWLGAIEKGLQSRRRVEQVWNMARTQGLAQTWEALNRKLGELTPAGYSSAGVVLETSGDDVPFRAGDRVACMGVGFANHAEFVSVPVNLVQRLPDAAGYEEGSFAALGCIALQGIRRLELGPGEKVGVIGLGLIGQVTVQLLTSLGYEAVGFDLSEDRARQAAELAGIRAWSTAGIDPRTRESGLDGVIVCAATSSDEPVNLALDLCRQRGRVVIVGDVGLGLDRAKMYRKELELRLSCSYGPGRYDPEYEFQGRDYPLGHVRWTEGRNLQLFCELLGRGRLRLRELVGGSFPLEQAPAAYATLKQGAAPCAVLFDYGPPPATAGALPATSFVKRRSPPLSARPGTVRLGIIGCGAFVRSVHLPLLAAMPDRYTLAGLASRTGATAEVLARRYPVPVVTSDYRVLLDSPEVDAVLVATRHASHARIALEALEAGKHVFVEKPLCLDVAEGEAIAARASARQLVVQVGFNRRFAPALQQMRAAFAGVGPRLFSCRINLGPLGEDWSNTEEEGGRLLGEGVHFFDLCNWFAGGAPHRVSGSLLGAPTATNPNLVAQFEYADGSIATVTYTSAGHAGAGKEWFEAIGGGLIAQCDDFRSLVVHGGRTGTSKFSRPDKGHRDAWAAFHAAVTGGNAGDAADATAGTWATAMARQAVASAAAGTKLPLNVQA